MSGIYMDYNATAPARVEASEAFMRALDVCVGNPSSTHSAGRRAKAVLDEARESLASVLGARAREVVFTGGGTESDNLAVKGVAAARGSGHIITTSVEHPAVMESCRELEGAGFDVTYLGVDADGRVTADAVAGAMRADTILVSVMWVNNETGVVAPVREIAELAKGQGVLFHSDAVQALGRLPIDIGDVPVDLLSISGHKFGAPKGIGALVARRGVTLAPMIHGGGQEWNLRSGTHNVPGAQAMGVAASLAAGELEDETARLRALRDRLETGVLERVHDVTVNGAGAERACNTSNIRIDGADGEAVLVGLDEVGIAASSASACAASHSKPSHVLMAMGLSRRQAEDSMRFSLGRFSSDEDVDALLGALPGIVERIRQL